MVLKGRKYSKGRALAAWKRKTSKFIENHERVSRERELILRPIGLFVVERIFFTHRVRRSCHHHRHLFQIMSSNINVKGITLSFADLFKQNLPPSQTHKVALPAKTSSNKIPSTSNFAADLTPSKSDSKSIADQQIIAAALSSSTCEAMSNDVLPLATPAPTCASFESTSSNDAQLFEESLVLTETLKSDPFDNQRVVQENGSANLTTTLAPTTTKPINIQKIVKRRGSIGKEKFILSQDDVVVSIDDDGVVSIDDDLPAADNAASQLLHLQPNHHDHNRNYPESSIPPGDDHLNSQSTPSSPPAVNVWLVRQEAMKKHDVCFFALNFIIETFMDCLILCGFN